MTVGLTGYDKNIMFHRTFLTVAIHLSSFNLVFVFVFVFVFAFVFVLQCRRGNGVPYRSPITSLPVRSSLGPCFLSAPPPTNNGKETGDTKVTASASTSQLI